MVSVQFSSVAQSCLTLRPHEPQQARPPCPSPTPGVHPNSHPLSQWCHPANSSSVVPFSCPQSFPESGSFHMSQFFASGSQSFGASASASVLPVNTQDWFTLVWTGWISLQSKGLSRVFSKSTVQKHQFFGVQLSLSSNSHIHRLLEKPQLWLDGPFWGSKITADGDCSHEIKTLAPWKESYDQPRQHIKKQRHYFANKVSSF